MVTPEFPLGSQRIGSRVGAHITVAAAEVLQVVGESKSCGMAAKVWSFR